MIARTPSGLTAALLCLLLLVGFSAPVRADGGSIELDGALDEDAWKSAVVFTGEAVETPGAPPETAVRAVTPRMLAVTGAGVLHVGVDVPDDPGPVVGVTLMLAPDGTKFAADAVEVSYRPFELRAREFTVRGPRGVGRGFYPVEAAEAARGRQGRWSIELRIALAPILGDSQASALRVAALIHTRASGVASFAPAEAAFAAPEKWGTVPLSSVARAKSDAFDVDALEAQDDREDERIGLWSQYLVAVHELKPEPGMTFIEQEVQSAIRTRMTKPLEKMRGMRKDLGPTLDILRADIARQLGNMDEADAFATSSIESAPAWREARFLRDVTIAVHRGLRQGHEGTSDFDAMLASLDGAKGDAWVQDGHAALRGILAYKRGDFSAARKALKPLVARYPTMRLCREFLRLSEKSTERVGADTRLSRRMTPGHAPRLRIRTTKGDVLVELFPDDAPNMVNNFVWLAKQGFYDGTALHRALPFSFVQGGDPFSRPADKGGVPDKVGLGGPGYTVPLESSGRPPLRGRLAAVKVGPGDNGSQFLITTGTCLHLDGDITVFGQTIDADAVLSKLAAGDRILGIDVVSLREGWEYRPVDRAGQRPDKAEARLVGE